MARLIDYDAETPLTQEETSRALLFAPRCKVCGRQPPVANRPDYLAQARGCFDATGWMRLQYPVPQETEANAELDWYCPKDAARAAGLLVELCAGRTKR